MHKFFQNYSDITIILPLNKIPGMREYLCIPRIKIINLFLVYLAILIDLPFAVTTYTPLSSEANSTLS